jgi:Na+/H+-translocating membrane pyrophosphatase
MADAASAMAGRANAREKPVAEMSIVFIMISFLPGSVMGLSMKGLCLPRMSDRLSGGKDV